MLVPEALDKLVKPWADFYSHSTPATSIVQFLHIGGLLLAGGLAISADRATIRSRKWAVAERRHQMAELAGTHKWVVMGLVVVVISGVGMLAADLDTFLPSWVYWTKMALVLVLLINASRMMHFENQLKVDDNESSPFWSKLHRVSIVSITLWFVITLFGAILANIS